MQIEGSLGGFQLSINNRQIKKYLRAVGQITGVRFLIGMKSPKTGRWYGGIQASAPGEYPAVRTGQLMRSMTATIRNNSVEFGTNMPYSKYLAYGTSKMRPRLMSVAAMQGAILQTPFKYPLTIKRRGVL